MKNTLRSKKNNLSNLYVKDYYDRQVGSSDKIYEEARWHSSLIQEFEYKQTNRALSRALLGKKYKTALEIGPGDGVWTRKIREHVSGNIHLVEQSEKMLEQAKTNLSNMEDITFERSDFMNSTAEGNRDLIVAIRSFEYFTEKSLALKKIFNLLNPGGKLIVVTKNSQLVTSSSVQGKTLHSDQVNRSQMKQLLLQNGFMIEGIYPAVIRWKIKYALLRLFFDIFHRITVWSKGWLRIPFVYAYATESFVYVASKPNI
jgi:ubiquinone/menaquinone biosynthesis C-methylase UbiE